MSRQMKTRDLTVEIKADVDKGQIEAYASTWDLDQGNDRIEKGAFIKTIAERFAGGKKRDVKVLWQHDMNQPIGVPIHMEEDSKGLYTISKISSTPRGLEALELARDGVVDKMSIGYDVIKSTKGSANERILKELKLYEYSLVTFPMNEKADIIQAKDVQALYSVMHKFGYTDLSSLFKGMDGGKAMDPKLLEALKVVASSIQDVIDLADEENPEGDDDNQDGGDGAGEGQAGKEDDELDEKALDDAIKALESKDFKF